MADSDIEIVEKKLSTLLQKGAKVYVRHTHGPSFLRAKWQGLWHLAHVERGWKEEDNEFTLLWARNGRIQRQSMQYSQDLSIQPFAPNKKTILNIEDDGNTDNIHTAQFVSFCEDESKITVRWDNRKVEEIDLSRVCLDAVPRRRRATDFYISQGKTNNCHSRKKAKKSQPISQEVEVLSISSGDESSDVEASKPKANQVTPDVRSCSYGKNFQSRSSCEESSDDRDNSDDEDYEQDTSGGEECSMSDVESIQGGEEDETNVSIGSTSSDEDESVLVDRPLSCKGSLRKKATAKKRYKETEASGDESSTSTMSKDRVCRRIDMQSVSSDGEPGSGDLGINTEHITKGGDKRKRKK